MKPFFNKLKDVNETLFAGVVILIMVIAFTFYNSKNTSIHTTPSTTPTPDITAYSKDELCKDWVFTSPSIQEVNFNKEMAQDRFVKYLRTALNNWLSGKYGSATHPKTSYECPYTGLMYGKQCPDGAFDEGDYSSGLSKIDPTYLKSKFIVLSADGAPGGGESIVLLFKDKPDKVFYAWVYRYRDDNDVIKGFDLRALDEYDLSKNEAPSVTETQKMFTNQICSPDIGF